MKKTQQKKKKKNWLYSIKKIYLIVNHKTLQLAQ